MVRSESERELSGAVAIDDDAEEKGKPLALTIITIVRAR